MRVTRTSWTYRFVVLPHRCFISKQWLWGRKHYKIVDSYHTYVGTFISCKWLHKEIAVQHILMHGYCEINEVKKHLA